MVRLGSSSRSLLLHPIHKSIIRFALLLFGLPAQFLRASPGGILFQRSLRFSNAGKAGFTASECWVSDCIVIHRPLHPMVAQR